MVNKSLTNVPCTLEGGGRLNIAMILLKAQNTSPLQSTTFAKETELPEEIWQNHKKRNRHLRLFHSPNPSKVWIFDLYIRSTNDIKRAGKCKYSTEISIDTQNSHE